MLAKQLGISIGDIYTARSREIENIPMRVGN
jgi:hypothetical protein